VASAQTAICLAQVNPTELLLLGRAEAKASSVIEQIKSISPETSVRKTCHRGIVGSSAIYGAPLVIATVGAAATAAKVVKELEDSASNIQVVDEVVQNLWDEFESPQSVLELMNDSFSRIEPIVDEKAPLRRVWAAWSEEGMIAFELLKA
jgi:hypothetical protein